MPPPMMTTSVEAIRSHELFQHRDERRRRVQRFGPPQGHAAVAGGGRRLNVDVEQNFGMVAYEADRSGEKPSTTGRRALSNHVAHVGANPRLRRPASALVG